MREEEMEGRRSKPETQSICCVLETKDLTPDSDFYQLSI